MITNKNSSKVLFIFLGAHLIIWTLVPTISNVNLPLDTIEALAWASNLDWGYYKHPPFSAYVAQVVYYFFGNNDWAYYLLSQMFVVLSFFYIWKLSNFFFQNKLYSLLSVLVLEGLVFLNYTTPEFNVYVCQLPIKVLMVYFFWKSNIEENPVNWVLVGFFAAIGILTHYSIIFLILALFIYFIFFMKKNKKIFFNFLISFLTFILIITPHLLWLLENNFTTILYAFDRANLNGKDFMDHFLNPFIFLIKQSGMLILSIILIVSIFSINKKRINFKLNDNKKIFLFSISILPIILVFIISMFTGAKIRTMWMSTFYLFFGLFIFYFSTNEIKMKKIHKFFYIFFFIFLLSPTTYLYISVSNDFKRTDYPGKEIARLVQNKWDQNFTNEIKIVVGDEWSAGNLSYHLSSRPSWTRDLKEKSIENNDDGGVIYTGNPEILKKICPGEFGTIKPVGYCMIGKR